MGKLVDKFNNLDKSIKRTIIGGIVVVAVIFIIVLIVGIMNNHKLSYSKLENKLESAAKSYFAKNEDKLPANEGEEVKVSSETLVSEEYIKELSKYNNDNCSADVYVELNNGEYVYSPYLHCDSYTTNTLVYYISNNEQIKTDKDGLYKYGDELVYRGENVNNYVKINDKIWRILRINGDNSVRLILNTYYDKIAWDDRYNISKNDDVGINDFEVSRMKDSLADFMNDTDYISRDLKKYIVAKNVCVDKVSGFDFSNIYNLNCTNYSEEKYQASLIWLSELFAASLDKNCDNIYSESCANYNYLAKGRFWTITPLENDTSKVFTTGGVTKAIDAYYSYSIKPVINISRHVLYESGNGTKKNPYTFKISSSK